MLQHVQLDACNLLSIFDSEYLKLQAKGEGFTCRHSFISHRSICLARSPQDHTNEPRECQLKLDGNFDHERVSNVRFLSIRVTTWMKSTALAYAHRQHWETQTRYLLEKNVEGAHLLEFLLAMVTSQEPRGS